MPIPSGKEAARPFVPAQDFAKSKAFYRALGFTVLLDSEVAIFSMGSTSFILSHFEQEDHNFMMQLMVDDLDGWWAHIQALDLPAKFGVPAPNRRRQCRGVCASSMSSIPPACCGTSRSGARARRTIKPHPKLSLPAKAGHPVSACPRAQESHSGTPTRSCWVAWPGVRCTPMD